LLFSYAFKYYKAVARSFACPRNQQLLMRFLEGAEAAG